MKPVIQIILLLAFLYVRSECDPNSGAKCALLVIDMQNDFTAATGKMPAQPTQVKAIIPAIDSLGKKLADHGCPSILIQNLWTNPFRGMFFGFAGKAGTWGGEMNPEISIPKAIAFPKGSPSAFSNEDLVAYLKTKDIHTLYVTGVKANQCVFATLKNGKQLGYEMVAVLDGIAADDDKTREKTFQKYRDLGIATTYSDSISYW